MSVEKSEDSSIDLLKDSAKIDKENKIGGEIKDNEKKDNQEKPSIFKNLVNIPY